MALPAKLKPCVTEKICDNSDATVYPIMKHLVEVDELGEREADRQVQAMYPKGQMPEGRARKIYYDRKSGTSVPPSKPKKKHTKPEVKIHLDTFVEAIKTNQVTDTDLKKVVDSAAKAVDKKAASPRVISMAASSFEKAGKKKGGASKKKGLVEKMVNACHSFVNKLDQVKSKGPGALTKDESRMINDEFKFIIPRMLRILTEMELDLSAILTNYVNPLKEVAHESDTHEQKAKRLLGD